MLNYTKNQPVSDDARGISLFQEIPKSRTCARAGIEMHWCACLSWKDADKSSRDVLAAANYLVQKLNDMTSSERTNCEPLKLDVIKDAGVFAPHSNLLRFSQSVDVDGRRPAFGHKMEASEIFYQLTIVTSPSQAQFESTLKYVPKTKQFSVSETEISRINKYGSQPHCIMEAKPHLRPYCYCRHQLPTSGKK